jgi:hypothetical protein
MGMGSLLGAGISGAASIFGASQQASAAKKAAAIQAQTAREAMNLQQGMFDKTQQNLAPYLATERRRLKRSATTSTADDSPLRCPTSLRTNSPGRT